ncbi:MAG TPA: FmdB family zinc ribbon protein, partial [Rhabdochlamydiaceae bacterium]|nr:FmdB family zinc ribbon protein [Rhabdochlamydiaceae bacterium]
MPTYGYQCTHCSHQMDAFQKITDDPLTQCPQCKKSTLQREIGGGSASFQFTGNGFYLTDYKKSKDPKSSCCPCGKKESCS